MQYAIETAALCRTFGSVSAVDGIDLRVPAGSVTGFLGPNGAGKTTTIRLLLGLLRPTSGSISVLGLDMPGARRRIARTVGALVETPCHYDNLTGRENIDVTRRLLGLPVTATDEVLELMDLRHAERRRVGGYSLGMRQRLGIARALLGRPRLLILDEPTNGLDPDGIVEVRKLIRALPQANGVTVLLSSHLLAEVEQTVDHVALIFNGKLYAQAPLPALLAQSRSRLRLEVNDPRRAVALITARGVAAASPGGDVVEVEAGREAAPDINRMLVASGLSVRQLVHDKPSLETAYLDLTGASSPALRAA